MKVNNFLSTCGLVPLRVLKPKMTAARVVSVRFMTILSKSSWEESIQKLFSTIKIRSASYKI